MNKVDIFNIINEFIDSGYEKAEDEFNIIQEIDYEADQIGLKWKDNETHDELMATFVSSFPESNRHLRILARTTVRRHASEASAQLDKYEQLLSEMIRNKESQLIDKLHLMYIETSETHRRQYKEVKTIIDFFGLNIIVKETKMGLLLREIADTNRLITDDDYLLKTVDGLDLLRPKWSKEFNYEYLFDMKVSTSIDNPIRSDNNNNNNKKRKTNN